jgi:hypothetical protein
MRSRHRSALITFGCCLLTLVQPTSAQAAEDLADHLKNRWFEIEIIIFERLNVLDVNSTEHLTLTTPRYWPHNMLVIDPLRAPLEILEPLNPLSEMSAYCLGYPVFPYPDPIHPDLLPQEAEDVTAVDEVLADGQSIIPDLTDDELEGSELTQDSLVLPEEAGQPPPQNSPQLTITPYLQVLADLAAYEQALADSSYQWLEQLTLENEVKAINRQSKLRPLLHRRWRQPVPARDEPQPVYLAVESNAASPLTRTGMAKLEGHVAVTVGRYLHLAATLWYHADNLGLTPVALPISQHSQPPSQVDARIHMALDESRRMRSGDLHYLDHPKFGVIVRIDPIEIPESLNKAWQALTEPPQDGL